MTATRTVHATGRQQLIDQLRAHAFLQNGDGVSVVGRDGERAMWMFNSWALSMTGPGLRLAAGELVAALGAFSATQLAATGHTAAPLLSGCLLLGDGRYSGLTVRERPKAYGPRWLIEGRGDRGRPVVVVDDSLSTGRSFARAAQSLEDDGYEVEGLLALVDFSTRGGREWIEALGYRVVTLFDIWADLAPPLPTYQPGHQRPAPPWSTHTVPAGLHPALAARHVAEHLLDTGTVALPPSSIDADVDGAGGAFVSLRRDDDSRIGRGGYWHFDASDAQPCRDVVLASIRTLLSLPRLPSRAELDQAKIAVTFFSELEPVRPTELDFARYGVVVRSTAFPYKAGGALPNTQLFTSTQEQYRHARRFNGAITDFEPHTVFRHDLVKFVEPGESWPAYGEPEHRTDGWTADRDIAERLVREAREVLGDALADSVGHRQIAASRLAERLPDSVSGVAVSLYRNGLVGTGLSWAAPIDDALVRATRAALAARSVGASPEAVARDAAVVVTLLYDKERRARVSAAGVAGKLRRGRDAFMVQDGSRSGLFLESVMAHHDWTADRAVSELARRTGVDDAAEWSTYKAASWCGQPGRPVHRLAFGYVDRSPGGRLATPDIELLAGHLRDRLDPDGWPTHRLWPQSGARDARGGVERGEVEHCIHALAALQRAGTACGRDDWQAAATRGLRVPLRHLDPTRFPSLELPERPGSALADARLLDAVAAAPFLRSEATDALGEKLARWVHADGSIRPPGATPVRSDADVLPGVTLLALVRYAAATGRDLTIDHAAVLRWYRRRFALLRSWGLAMWHTKAWAELAQGHRADVADGGEPAAEAARFAFELADWMVGRQLQVDGSYLVDQGHVVPTFTTALVADAVGVAGRLAAERGDHVRADRYRASWQAAMGFLDRLLVRAEDTFWMADPDSAVGGVRMALATAELRVDYTSHTLEALLAGWPLKLL